ncbi:hypothetical protein V6N13_060056 [Hibiscus sabdariffa]
MSLGSINRGKKTTEKANVFDMNFLLIEKPLTGRKLDGKDSVNSSIHNSELVEIRSIVITESNTIFTRFLFPYNFFLIKNILKLNMKCRFLLNEEVVSMTVNTFLDTPKSCHDSILTMRDKTKDRVVLIFNSRLKVIDDIHERKRFIPIIFDKPMKFLYVAIAPKRISIIAFVMRSILTNGDK